MAHVPNLDLYSPTQLQELKDAVIAERMRRLTGGTVTSGSKNGKSYGVLVMSNEELSMLEEQIAKKLGLRKSPQKRRINFNHCGLR